MRAKDLGSGGEGTTDLGTDDGSATPPASGDPYKDVFNAVSQANIEKRLRELTGADAVTVGSQTFKITDRWAPASKANFRAYFTQYFTALGATVNVLPFTTTGLLPGETQGHNVEAILPGKSADSVVIIVHYDTVGIKATTSTATSPTSSICRTKRRRRACTTGHGSPTPNSTFQLITCASATLYNYPDLATGFLGVASAYSTMKPTAMCDASFDTDHFDDTGNDTLQTVDTTYLWQLSQIQIAFQAELMGIGEP
jgi:hypothetical protein